MEFPTIVDYIVVGGGLTGCAVATRLAERLGPSVSVLLVEAGPDPSGNPNTTTPMAGFALEGSELDWSYPSSPIPTIGDRVLKNPAGKTLGGGSVLNYGGWARGDASDYDAWAKIVGDERWSYDGLLPYMKRSEKFNKLDANANPQQHGFDGPIKVTGISASDPKRRYPLREPIQKAWAELGIERVPSGSGKLAGLSEFLETWDNGIRQPAHLAYGLAGVDVRTEIAVHKVLFESLSGKTPRATGILLVDGRQIQARKEIILATGALRTPQLLQLSGVGPAAALARHSIPLIYDSPGVGTNLFDHFALFQVFQLRHPERGLALGHPALADPAFVKGLPVDWVVNEALTPSLLKQAVAEDGDSDDTQGLGKTGRTHAETMILYIPYVPGLPFNGTYIATSVMLTLPTSRGTVGLASASPTDPPVIEPNYFATAMDRAALVHGARRLLQCLTGTTVGQDLVETEVAPVPGMKPLTLESSTEEIEERIRAVGSPHFHAAGTCALGSVVDAELRVKGVEGLRITDASIFPAPLGGHPQATLYAIAERAAAIIAGEKDEFEKAGEV
ncbi:glucose-methanol-choline oxidoreductase-like protein [Coleophoma cylindrospora]|uniref:Glucose-methanol-choline oxidoreductase-like protein n=1 Tax=Coleophoma cylindrospora TaxID=1849047 RepID=A0A3D8S8A4_9HELO|nr:glucose-methanol-choline oxidoreductase-like protein [Coleophoma cylindrospora]